MHQTLKQAARARAPATASRPRRTARLSVQAKVNIAPGAPRVLKGRCFVTKDVSG
jgi:hypothetical protein